MAQVPQGVGYQGVAADANGDELVNQSISIRASVLSASANGTIEWEETHATSTDTFGLFTLTIGQGTSTGNGAQLSFADISWGTNTHYLKIEMDVTGGANYSFMGTNQMMSVPYALYAESANINYDSISNFLSGDSTFITNVGGGMGGGGCDYSFPEGIEGQTIAWDLGVTGNYQNYTVPAGKNLFITNVHSDYSESFRIDGILVIDQAYSTTSSLVAMLKHPICVKSGQVVSFDGPGGPNTFYGILTDAVVDPISFWFDDPGTGFDTYTVPVGKRLIVTNLWKSGDDDFFIDGVVIASGIFNKPVGNSTDNKYLEIPLIINSGSIVSVPNHFASFNGYLADENYFAGCGGGGSSTIIDYDSLANIISMDSTFLASFGSNCNSFGETIHSQAQWITNNDPIVITYSWNSFSIDFRTEMSQANTDGILIINFGDNNSSAGSHGHGIYYGADTNNLYSTLHSDDNWVDMIGSLTIPVKKDDYYFLVSSNEAATEIIFFPFECGGGSLSSAADTMSVSTFGDTLTMNGQSIIVPGISVQNFPSSLMGSVTDFDGNTYQTIILGNQEWMAENLNTTHFANGNNLNDNSGNGIGCASQPGYKDNLSGDNFRYYNALAVHDPSNVCPTGWHVPSTAEFATLLGMFGYFNNNDWIGSAVALKSTEPFAWVYSVTSNGSMLNFKRDGIIYCGLNEISHTDESWTWTSTLVPGNSTQNIKMNDSSGNISGNSDVIIGQNTDDYNLPIRCIKE
jgi:uncharacterized protein (TIGR02145 family)